MMAAPLMFRGGGIPLLRHRHRLRLRLIHYQNGQQLANVTLLRRPIWSTAAAEPTKPENSSSVDQTTATAAPPAAKDRLFKHQRRDDPDYRKWEVKEEEILLDIDPIVLLTKDILHSDRYLDGQRLSAEDEKLVVQKLLAHHPQREDKIGCGLDSIMVDRHPQFKQSRCLFVVRTDGVWIDFSYQKCLRSYIRNKYPSYAERFIKEHFKRGSS